jgi:hypothetical protein
MTRCTKDRRLGRSDQIECLSIALQRDVSPVPKIVALASEAG